MFDEIIKIIKRIYKTRSYIPLHEPKFIGNEKKYLNKCIDSNFISTSGDLIRTLELNGCPISLA